VSVFLLSFELESFRASFSWLTAAQLLAVKNQRFTVARTLCLSDLVQSDSW
jgi:hypothetical protein